MVAARQRGTDETRGQPHDMGVERRAAIPVQIVVLSWRDLWHPRAGGAERVTFEHMRRWAQRGHTVTLFTAHYSGAAYESTHDGVRIIRRGKSYGVYLHAFSWLRRQQADIDVIIDEVHGLPFGAAFYTSVPTVANIYEVARDIWWEMYPAPVALAGRALERMALRLYAQKRVPFIAISSSTTGDLQSEGVPQQMITTIPPGLDITPVATLPSKVAQPTLIFVGRLVRMKRVDHAIRALALLRPQLPDAALWIAGDGDHVYRAELVTLARQLCVSDAVQFLGRISEAEKLQRLQQAHVLVHPSVREGWGINVLEANTMGTVAVGYDVPGLRDSIRHGETGILCQEQTPDALARAILELLRDPHRMKAMRLQALIWAGSFTWEKAAEKSLEVLTASSLRAL